MMTMHATKRELYDRLQDLEVKDIDTLLDCSELCLSYDDLKASCNESIRQFYGPSVNLFGQDYDTAYVMESVAPTKYAETFGRTVFDHQVVRSFAKYFKVEPTLAWLDERGL